MIMFYPVLVWDSRIKEIMKFIDQQTAKSIDTDLMTNSSFTLDQLIELAGLSIAQSIHHYYPSDRKMVVVVGPGNNGGDGLVAARHLAQFGHEVGVVLAHDTPAHHVHVLEMDRNDEICW